MEILTSVKRLYISFKSLVNDSVYSFGRAALLLMVEVQNHTFPVRERGRIRVNSTCLYIPQRAVVTYSSQTWILTAINKKNLRIFERKIFCPVNINNKWRIRNNMELDKLIKVADVVRFIKAQRLKWLGHIQRMDQARPTGKLLDWRPTGTSPV